MTNYRTITILLVLLLSVEVAFGIRKERVVDTWKPTHYVVNITLNDQLSEISAASARIEIVAVKKLSVIDLDFGELTTDRVTLNSNPIAFVHKNGKLEIKLPTP